MFYFVVHSFLCLPFIFLHSRMRLISLRINVHAFVRAYFALWMVIASVWITRLVRQKLSYKNNENELRSTTNVWCGTKVIRFLSQFHTIFKPIWVDSNIYTVMFDSTRLDSTTAQPSPSNFMSMTKPREQHRVKPRNGLIGVSGATPAKLRCALCWRGAHPKCFRLSDIVGLPNVEEHYKVVVEIEHESNECKLVCCLKIETKSTKRDGLRARVVRRIW